MNVRQLAVLTALTLFTQACYAESVAVSVGADFSPFEDRLPTKFLQEVHIPRDIIIAPDHECRSYKLGKEYMLEVCISTKSGRVTSLSFRVPRSDSELSKVNRSALRIESFTIDAGGVVQLQLDPFREEDSSENPWPLLEDFAPAEDAEPNRQESGALKGRSESALTTGAQDPTPE